MRWLSRCRRQTRSGQPCQAPPGNRCEAPREAAQAWAGCGEPVRSLRRAPAFLSRFAPDDPDLFRNRPVPDRLLVVSAGVTANLAFAFLVVYAQALTVGVPMQAQLPGVLVPEVRPGSAMDAVQAAERALTEARPTSPARSRGIHVSQFSIGFGPALARFCLGPVEYALRAIPLGGYVGFPDDDPESGFAPDDPDLLRNRPVPDRLLVVSVGVTANLAFAFLVVYAQALTVGVPVQAQLPGVLVPEVRPGSAMDVVQAAERALTEARPTSPARSRGGGLAMDADDTEAGGRVMRM
jgi:membrane-associated protease RseP (regulator of RpoE activity)